MFKRIFSVLILATSFVGPSLADSAEDKDTGPQVYFISPGHGAHVTNPIQVIFGLRGMGIAPAGTDKAGTGHHHLIIDADLPPLDENIPMDENHVHFGGGQTETTIELPPGEHTLQLLLGDMNHIPHNPPLYSNKITIIVTE